MSDFELVDQGEGRFALQGEMSFHTAQNILRKSEALFRRYESLDIDLAEVGKADSAGLALIIEWKAQAARRQADIRFRNTPASVLAIAKTAEVEDLV